MKRWKVLLSLSVLITVVSLSHALEISGRVTDEKNGQPLPLSHLELENASIGTIADDRGDYHFTGLAPGNYVLSASYLGYKVAKIRLKLENDDLEVDFSLEPLVISGQEVIYSASRAVEGKSPISFTDLSAERIRESYWTQDIPPMLASMPGVYSWSEMGEGIGYTHLNIRGFDTRRLGVTINNVPLNDPEDGNVYWVDTPDLASNIADIQVQRGVGFTRHGTSAFGGSVNLVTMTPAQSQPQFNTITGAGSFNTRKWGISFNSGLVNNTYGFYGRFSRIQTDGYRDNSGVDLISYFLTGVRYGAASTLTLNVYGGREITHAAWYASAESDLRRNRKDNPYSYPNTVDNFSQPRYELHYDYRISEKIDLLNTLYYVRGEGYYEQFKRDAELVDFGYQPFDGIESSDLVNQKWVAKDHLGWAPMITWDHASGSLTIGGDLQWFESDHHGYVLYGDNLPPDAEPRHKYYQFNGKIRSGGLFIREQYEALKKLTITGDAGLRYRYYKLNQDAVANFQGEDVNRFEVNYLFFNPKLGVSYRATPRVNLFTSIGLSHRAPSDNEYWDTWHNADDLGEDPLFSHSKPVIENGQLVGTEWSDPRVDPERTVDLELGAGYRKDAFLLKANLYWMDFHNEIVPQGGFDPDYGIARGNADRSVHSGFELEISYLPKAGFNGWANLSLSSNKLKNFILYDWDENGNTISDDLSGNTIALFPSRLLTVGMGYKTVGFDAGFDLRYVGNQYLDNTENDQRTVDSHIITGMTVGYVFDNGFLLKSWEMRLRINNLFNIEYETSGYYDPWANDGAGENFYFVGAERNMFLTFTMSW